MGREGGCLSFDGLVRDCGNPSVLAVSAKPLPNKHCLASTGMAITLYNDKIVSQLLYLNNWYTWTSKDSLDIETGHFFPPVLLLLLIAVVFQFKYVDKEAYASYAYDAVWVFAYALDRLLKEDPSALESLHTPQTTEWVQEHISTFKFEQNVCHFVGNICKCSFVWCTFHAVIIFSVFLFMLLNSGKKDQVLMECSWNVICLIRPECFLNSLYCCPLCCLHPYPNLV